VTNPYAPPTASVEDLVGVAERTEPAGRAVRLGAAILDGIIFGALVYLPFIAGFIAFSTNQSYLNTRTEVGFLLGGVGFAVWAYLTINYVRANGQSIAKKMVGIRVVRTNGAPASFSRIFWLRNVVNGLPGFIPVLGVLYTFVDVLFIFNEARQCLHDKIADTIVVLD
jgi:uncharacterized RDD family membrane protein YckC